jgi:hypothetical protein
LWSSRLSLAGHDISKLAVIATIRTMLNYFLAKDIMAFDKSQEAGSEAGAAQNRPESGK